MSAATELRRSPDHPAETSVAAISPEFELLLACCALPQAQREGQLVYLTARKCDFPSFVSLAQQQRVIPQAYQALALHSGLLRAQDLAQLRSAYQKNARTTLWLTAELVRILRHLETHGIKAMPYKGPALAQVLYGDVTARQFIDLDILVSLRDVSSAKDALRKFGYNPTEALSAREERAFISSGYEYAFDGIASPHLVELKWRILPHFYSVEFDTEEFFKRAEQITLAGHSFPTLRADDLLFVLCVHAAKHRWTQLSWLHDIAQLIQSRGIDWDAVWHRTHSLGVRRIIALNLMLTHDLLGSNLPPGTRRWLENDSETRSLQEEILRMIRDQNPCETDSPAYFYLMLRLRERWLDKIRLAWRLIGTPAIGDWSSIHLPDQFFPLYRLVRLGRLASKAGRALQNQVGAIRAHSAETIAFTRREPHQGRRS
ncbi:MAG TPA: nucleotidyltransferase family protein [Terriglobales bacterium]|nr:nucleotidyltransferase family protein [Terriglobales bacterium]